MTTFCLVAFFLGLFLFTVLVVVVAFLTELNRVSFLFFVFGSSLACATSGVSGSYKA